MLTLREKLLIVGTLAALAVIFGAAAVADRQGEYEPAARPSGPAPPRPMSLELVDVPVAAVRKPSFALRGRVTPGATLTVGGRDHEVAGSVFRIRVPLAVGVNRIPVTASKPGFRDATRRLRVRRRKPPPATAPVPAPSEPPSAEPAPTAPAPAPSAPTSP